MDNLVQKFLPKQADIDKMLKVIQRKVLKGTHLPVEIKEIQAGYLTSTGGSRLSRIFWEHENLSGLSIIRLIQLL